MADTPEKEHSPYLVTVSENSREHRRHQSPSVARNTAPILAVLHQWLPAGGRALEVASGTGEHSVAFAGAFPAVQWQPSDPHPDARRSIAAWGAEAALPNLAPPLHLDLTAPAWEAALAPGLAAMVAINVLHISPWAACLGLMRGAAALLQEGGRLIIYGCFSENGAHLSPGNATFHVSLRGRNPAWGVRGVQEVAAAGTAAGLRHRHTEPMPADNRMLILER